MRQTELQYLMLVITMAASLCLVTSDQFIQPEELRDFTSDLILKKMRFREVEDGENSFKTIHKRPQEKLVNNLMALLSHLKQRQTESNQRRMSSLRFGK